MWRRSSGDLTGAGDGDGYGDGEGCATKRVVKTECWTEPTDSGRLVRKCEKTEQLLRQCAGRAAEVVKSNTEYTEEDVTNESIKKAPPHLEGPLGFPGLRSDIEALERNMFGGLSRMMDAVEEMTKGFFGELGRPSIFEQEPSADSRSVPDRFFSKEDVPTKPSNESAYGEFAGKVADV